MPRDARLGLRAIVVVTSDKCYENREWWWPYREDEAMGGHDPYSSSKGCAELVTAAWRRSFFPSDGAAPVGWDRRGPAMSIGGGDWAEDRLVPDCMRALCVGRARRRFGDQPPCAPGSTCSSRCRAIYARRAPVERSPGFR